MKTLLLLLSLFLSVTTHAQSNQVITLTAHDSECPALLRDAETALRNASVSYVVSSSCRYCAGCSITQNAAITIFDDVTLSQVGVQGQGGDCDRNLQSGIQSVLNGRNVAFAQNACRLCAGCSITENATIAVLTPRYGGGNGGQTPSVDRIRQMVGEALDHLAANDTYEARKTLLLLERLLER